MVNFLENYIFTSDVPKAKITSACPDQIIGNLCNGKFEVAANRIDIDYLVKQKKDTISNILCNPIVVILESPHKDEYDPITLNALGPCMGVTGKNFKSYFEDTVAKSRIFPMINSDRHDIIILNAVQYQCSLGEPLSGKRNFKNKKQRDDNFIKCLSSNDLIRRIAAIKPSVVINLCTKGICNLQQLVSNKIESIYRNNYTIGNHPSCWWDSNLRVIN